MSDRVVRAVITGSSTGAVKAFEETANAADKAGKKAASSTADSGNKVSGAIKAVVGAVGSVSVAGIAEGAIGEFNALQSANANLSAAMKDAGEKAGPGFADSLDKAQEAGERLGFSAADTTSSIAALRKAGIDTATAMKDQTEIEDLAASKHISLADATTAVIGAIQGNGKALKDLNVQMPPTLTTAAQLAAAQAGVTKATGVVSAAQAKYTAAVQAHGPASAQAVAAHAALEKAQTSLKAAQDKLSASTSASGDRTSNLSTVVGILQNKVGGQAQAAASTFSGRLNVLKTEAEGAATKGIGALTPAVGFLSGVIGFLTDHLNIVGPILGALTAAFLVHKAVTIGQTVATSLHTAATGIWTGVQGAATAAQWLFNAAMDANPIVLVVLGVAALIAIFVVLQAKFGIITDAVHALSDVFGDIIGWLKNNWPLVLGILTGPFGLAIAFIATHFTQVKEFFTGLVSDIGGIFGGIGSAISSGFRAGLNMLIGMVNGLIGLLDAIQIHIPSVGVGPIHTPSFDWGGLGIPKIPTLATGGLVVSSGLAVVHEGETFSGVRGGRGGRGGDTYNITPVINVYGGDPQAVVNALKTYMARNGSIPVTVNAARRLGPA